MPTESERKYYRMGFNDGIKYSSESREGLPPGQYALEPRKPKSRIRKISAWNMFVKTNSKKKIFRYANGKLKLKKMGIAFRKTRAGKKK